MKHILRIFIFLLAIQIARAQNSVKDSILITNKNSYKKKDKITFVVENKTGQEIQRMNPMGALQLFKWNGNEWVQVTMLGYCSCGMVPCPPPPMMLPFNADDKISFDWDQMESRCIDNEKGTKEYKWVGKGKYKVIFEFKRDLYYQSFHVEKEFKIRGFL